MANPTKWSNVAVAIQSALATAVTVNSVSKANPGVIGYTGTDPSQGDYVVMSAQGMTQINNRVFRLGTVSTGDDTAELTGIDTTAFGTFSSGSMQVITFGTSMTTATGLTSSGGGFSFIDTTTIHDAISTQIPGLPEPVTFTFDCIWDPSDAGFKALKEASDAQAVRAIRFTFANGAIAVFNGFVAASGLPGGQAQGLVTTQVVITMHGAPTYYAS